MLDIEIRKQGKKYLVIWEASESYRGWNIIETDSRKSANRIIKCIRKDPVTYEQAVIAVRVQAYCAPTAATDLAASSTT